MAKATFCDASASTPLHWAWKPKLSFYLGLFAAALFADGKDGIHKNAEDERGGDVGNGDLAEVQGQTADTGDEDRCNHKQVAVFIKVDMLEHPQAGDRDEAIERDAHATHYAARDGIHKRHKWSKEGQDYSA